MDFSNWAVENTMEVWLVEVSYPRTSLAGKIVVNLLTNLPSLFILRVSNLGSYENASTRNPHLLSPGRTIR